MSQADQDTDRHAGLWVVFVTVAVLVTAVMGFAIHRTLQRGAATAPTPAAVASAAGATEAYSDVAATGPALAVLFFDSGKTEPKADGLVRLDAVQQTLSGGTARQVLVSGFHDSQGDPVKNAELARQRAKAVQALLIARGVPAAQVLLRKPEVAAGGGSDDEARRVELRIVEGS
jgi:outer membrane protein OmpA-like peptidoglycan-associated protein